MSEETDDFFKNGFQQNILDKLYSIDAAKVQKIPHMNEIIPAYVYDVHDGDTCNVIILHGYQIPMKLSVRALGVNTPEITCSSKQSLHPELEKKAGIKVRDYVKKMIEHKIIPLKIVDWDKFGGRVLGIIYLSEVDFVGEIASCTKGDSSLATHLIEMKYGLPYHGEKKKQFAKEELEYICK